VFEKPLPAGKPGEPILLTGSMGGRAKTIPLFRPPCQKAEAKRTISSFSFPPLGKSF